MLILAGVAGAGAITWGYWIFKVRPRIEAIEGRGPVAKTGRFRSLKRASASGSFDRAFTLPMSPLGAAWDGRHFIVGDRKGGALRIRQDGDDMDAQSVPILEPIYRQNLSVSALTWNGRNFIGYADAAWFQKSGYVFTTHDRESLAVLGHRPAPDNNLGCLAFDGTFYWAATRRNTEDSPEPALLYKLDRDFTVVSKMEAPGVGCQGMTWDGRYLWLADVFSDSITILDPSSDPPRVVHSESTAVEYLSGIVSVDGEIWITDYGNDSLRRLRPATRLAWAGGTGASTTQVLAGMMTTTVMDRPPVHFARDEERSPERPEEDSEVLDWQVELRGNEIYGSWRIWFGDKLFSETEQDSTFITVPKFAKYTFTIRDPSGAEVKKEFEATAGENVMRDVLLAEASLPGDYRVDLFIHVQYVTADGQGRILNNSEMGLGLRK